MQNKNLENVDYQTTRDLKFNHYLESVKIQK